MQVNDGAVEPDPRPAARLELQIESLSSGNALYDAELRRRIDARRYPRAIVELRELSVVGDVARYQLQGDLTFHGITREVRGTISANFEPDGSMKVAGEQIFDIRDFNVPSPTILMLKIFPDVRVRLDLVAQPEG
jgi:polyisoprenoid-binding protein YceI